MEQLTNETVVTDLARQIEQRMNHPYLTKHEVVPAVDMLLLRWMVEMIDLESIEHRQLVMATYFAHQALVDADQVAAHRLQVVRQCRDLGQPAVRFELPVHIP